MPLADLRLAFSCKESWGDMVGDDRVRHCNGCDRQVFNLSEMTRDEAEAVLATRGIKPCVRFAVVAGTTLLSSSAATADPPSCDPAKHDVVVRMGRIVDLPSRRPAIEWSTWIRGGFGFVTRSHDDGDTVARSTTPSTPESTNIGELALGADLTLGIANRNNLRLGAWAETRTTSNAVFGGELVVLAHRSYNDRDGGRGLVVRVGGNTHAVTTALGYGDLGIDGLPHHATATRFVVSVTTSSDELTATIGLELDPIGALGYLVRLVTDD